MIEIKNLYKRYHNHHGSDWVLRDINLTIPSGVSVGLIGANGAGKSTLLRLIAGIDIPERGEVIRHSRVSWPVGLSGGMQGSMTGRQNVKFVARAQGCTSTLDEIVRFVENFAEIGLAFDEPVKTYSSGMRARLSFGLSFAFDFDVYISDEATAVGDRQFKSKAQELFKSRVQRSSLIMVSHGEGILRELCEAGIYIKNGNAIWFDDINDAILEYHIDNQSAEVVDNTEIKNKSLNLPFDPLLASNNEILNLKKLIKDKKNKQKNLWQVIVKAKENNWDKKEINVLSRIHNDWKKETQELIDLLNSTPIEKAHQSKQEVIKLQKIVETMMLIKAEKLNQAITPTLRTRKTIDKAIEMIKQDKILEKSKLDSLDVYD